MSKYFKTNLKYLRNKNGIEQLELANMLGLKSASAVSEWEKGIRIPNAGILSDLSNIFNVTSVYYRFLQLKNVMPTRFDVSYSTISFHII